MPTSQRPTSYLNWTQGQSGQVAEPPANVKATGFQPGQPLPAVWLNWLFWRLDNFTQYFDSSINATVLSTTLDDSTRLIGGGQFSYSASTNALSWSAPFSLSVPSLPDADNTAPAGSVTLGAGQLAYVQANLPFTTEGDTSSGSTTVLNLDYELGISAGQAVTGKGIPAGTTVVSLSGDTLTLSAAATATNAQTPLTFASTGPLSVSVANVAELLPAPNTIVLARGTGATVLLGVNAATTLLRDGERKILGGLGYTHVQSAAAGVSISRLQAVYLSPGTGDLDGSTARTAGAAYLTEASAAKGPIRSNVFGFAISSSAASKVPVMTSGILPGLSGLTPGVLYYLDPATPGAITSTKPSPGQSVVNVGVALASDTLFVRPSQTGGGSLDGLFNDVTIRPIDGNASPIGLTMLNAAGQTILNVDPNGQQLAAAGTASAPARAYVGQADTGEYLATQSTTGAVLAWALNKIQKLSLSNTGLTSLVQVNAPSYSSGNGFKAIVEGGVYFATTDSTGAGAAPTSYTSTFTPLVTGTGTTNIKAVYIASHPGSVVGCSIYLQDPMASGITVSVQVIANNYINGQNTWNAINAVTGSTGVPQPKGSTYFYQGSSVYAQIKFSSANAITRVRVTFTVEMDG